MRLHKSLYSQQFCTLSILKPIYPSPKLLNVLESDKTNLSVKLNEKTVAESSEEKISLDEKAFRYMHNGDAMAVDKLADGIRKFAADQVCSH